MPTLANWFHGDRFRTVPHFGLTCQCSFCNQPDRGAGSRAPRAGPHLIHSFRSLRTECPIWVFDWMPYNLRDESIRPFFDFRMLQEWGDDLGKRKEREKDLWKGQPDHKAQDLTGAYEALRDLIAFLYLHLLPLSPHASCSSPTGCLPSLKAQAHSPLRAFVPLILTPSLCLGPTPIMPKQGRLSWILFPLSPLSISLAWLYLLTFS